jgi:hypothetical protein
VNKECIRFLTAMEGGWDEKKSMKKITLTDKIK